MNLFTKRQAVRFCALLVFSLLALVFTPCLSSSVQAAGKEAVFIGADAYFTLEEAYLSHGTVEQTLRFGIALNNDASRVVDFNNYGVRIMDDSGNIYSAAMAEKGIGRVQPGQSQLYRYTAQLPLGLPAEQIKVDIFEWEFGAVGGMSDLGALSVSSALSSATGVLQKGAISLSEVDAALPGDSAVTFEVERSYKVLANGTWNLYVDTLARNDSSSTLKLPSALQFGVKDPDQLSYAATLFYGGDQPILPHQSNRLVLQAPLGNAAAGDNFTLELLKKTASSGSGSSGGSGSGNNTGGTGSNSAASTAGLTPLAAVSLQGTLFSAAPGAAVNYSATDKETLAMITETVKTNVRSDGLNADATFTLRNDTKTVLPVPSLSAFFQVRGSTLSVTAAESAAHPAFLSPGESTTYRFKAALRTGVQPETVDLVVMEKRAGAAALSPIFISPLPAGTTGGSGNDAASAGGILTPIGNLSMSLNSVYRLATEGDEDILMSEITVQNLEDTIVQLPALYGGFKTYDDLDLPGKVVRVQSSSYLNPHQKTTIYLYSKISYQMPFERGTLYMGDGIFDAKTSIWSKTREWNDMPVTIKSAGINGVPYATDWFINDTGRKSTAQIVDTKVYEAPDHKVVAMRILQKNKEARNGSSVSYSGYMTNEDGTVWAAKVDEEPGKLCKECAAMSTLWVSVPTNLPVDKLSFVFGQKLDDQAFASAQSFAFVPSNDQNDVKGNSVSIGLNPYSITMTNIAYVYTSKKIDVIFDYTIDKGLNATGAGKNRALSFELFNEAGKSVKIWDVPLEGTGAILTGTRGVLSVDTSAISDINKLLQGPKMNIYEKFEGATRLLGSLEVPRSTQ